MKNSLLVPEIREYLAKKDERKLEIFCESGHPVIIAEFVSSLPPAEAWEVLQHAAPMLRSEVFSHLDPDIQIQIAKLIRRSDFADLLTDMSPDDRVDLYKRIPEQQRDAILPAMAQAEREDIRRLASYPEGTAGAVMTSDYAALTSGLTAGEAIEKLRREAPDKETIYYAYVVDESRKLKGSVSLKDLILAQPITPIRDIMNPDVISVQARADQEAAARIIQKYDLIALPVIDENDTLVGIITHDDAFDIITQEQTEDLEKFMAIAGDHETGVYLRTSAWEHFKNRSGWIVLLAALGLVSGFIVQSFEGLLLQFAILATFMPMLADAGGNTGSQSATLVIRALALKEISSREVFSVLKKEAKVSILLGLLLAALAFLRVLVFSKASEIPQGNSIIVIAAAIAAALTLQVVTATLIGALLPLIAAKMRLDPAVVASPALTTVVDITGLFIYFSIAEIIIGI